MMELDARDLLDTNEELRKLNHIADSYDLSPFDSRMRNFMMRSLAPFLVPGSALEMGCFHGDFTSLLAEKYRELTVVEAANAFIEKTRSRVGKRVKFVHSLFETYETVESFDAIFLLHVLEHVDDPVSVLTKARTLLSEKGRIYLVVPNGNAASRRIAVKMGVLASLAAPSDADTRHGHRTVYFFDTLERDAKYAGLSILHRGGIFFKALANFQFDRLIGSDILSDEYLEGCYQLGMEFPDLCASIFLVCEAGEA